MPSARLCALYAALLLTTAAIAADAPAPLPFDLAFARRDAWKQLQPAISPDGRYLAYDVRTPPQRMDNGPGETADLYLPSGFISIFAGVQDRPVLARVVVAVEPSACVLLERRRRPRSLGVRPCLRLHAPPRSGSRCGETKIRPSDLES